MFKFLKNILAKRSSPSSPSVVNVDDNGDFIYNDSLNISAYDYPLENGEYVLWTGVIPNIEFTYYAESDKRERILGNLVELRISETGDFILVVQSHDSTTTKVLEKLVCTKYLVGSTRYKFVELCQSRLKIEGAIFSFAKAVRHEASTMLVKKTITPIAVSFTHVVNKDRTKVALLLDTLLKNKHGTYMIGGVLAGSGERKNFFTHEIDTKYTIKDIGKLSFSELKEKLF